MHDLNSPEYYLNRDLSLLQFHRRVYELATDKSLPLLERLRFLCISCTNLDEFFEVRVAALKHQLTLGVSRLGADQMRPAEALQQIRCQVSGLVDEQYSFLNEVLLPELAAEGIVFLPRHEWSEEQAAWIKQYFHNELMPLLTPISLDPAHPFPKILNKILTFVVALEGKDAFGRDLNYGIVHAPRSLPRVIRLPDACASEEYSFVFLSSIIHAHIHELFPGMRVTACHQFRITRNSELYLEEDEVEDLKRAVAGELLERRYGEMVRLEVSTQCPPELSDFLLHQFGLSEQDLYRVNGPVNLYRLAAVCDVVGRAELKFPEFTPGLPRPLRGEGSDLFEVLRQQDLLLYHPYQSFAPVVDLLRRAADDPSVVAVKQTLYRVVPGSPIVDALVRAARAGKEVTAVIELRARFNEEDNIGLADRLQDAGVQVVYGVVGFKTHGKMLLVVRKEGNRLRRYVHLGTGNYHTLTTRHYTDFGLLSADPSLGEDVHRLFMQLTGMGRASRMHKLLQSPFSLHRGMLERIALEAENARQGGKGRIIAKMNGLEDPEIIRSLYEASQAGVKIDLIVRGICCLRPGIPGVSDNIRVYSVLGRFLEHTRVFYFHNGGDEEVFCASADWLVRNLHRRVEVCFPIENKKLKQQVIRKGLRVPLSESRFGWRLQRDGSYRRIQSRGKTEAISSQEKLLAEFGQD